MGTSIRKPSPFIRFKEATFAFRPTGGCNVCALSLGRPYSVACTVACFRQPEGHYVRIAVSGKKV